MKKNFEKRVIIWLFFCVYTLSFTQTKANAISSNAITGNWSSLASWSGGIVPTKNDTVTIVSGSTITVDIDTSKCYKLKINSGGTLNVSSHIMKCYGSNVSKFVSPSTFWFIGNGHCTIYSGGTLNLNTGTLCLTGDFTTNGTFNCGTGTIVFDTKRAPLAIYGTNIPTFYNVINKDSIPASYPITGGFGVTLHNDNTIIKGNLVVDGTFNRNTSATNDTTDITFAGTTTVSGMYSLYLNDVIINSGATLSMPLATSKTIYLYGDWTSNGTFVCGINTLWLSRDPQHISLVQNIYQANPDLNPFYNLYTNKTAGSVTQIAGALNTNGNLYVSNNFTVNKGTWDMGGVHRLYVGGNFIVTSGVGNGIYTASQGRLLMNGANAVTQQTLNTGGSSLYKYTIMNTGAGVIQASDVTVTYEIQFTSGIQYTKNVATLYELYLSNNDPSLSLPAGYSATSFLIGKFRRAVTGANNYSYPVGPLNTLPVKYRPFIYQQTAAGGANNVFIVEDAITNTGTYYANWWAQIQPDAGTPTGTFNFSYNLSNDFRVGMTECAMSVLRGSIPLPADWNWVLATTLGASGGNSGTTSAAMPTTFSPYAFILGEPVPVAAATSICSGNSTLLVVTSPKGDGTYNWYDAATGGNLIQLNSTSYNTPVLNSSTTYYVSQVNNLTGCATHTTPVAVTVTAAPAVNAGINRSICSGSNLVISGTSATNYTALNWASSGTGSFTNNGTLTPSYTPSVADISSGSVTLTLNATGSAPCGTFNDAMALTIVSLPTANAGTDATICSGNTTTMGASGGTTYAWSPSTGLSATNISNPVANPTTATNYTVTVTNAGGCSAVDNVTVNVNATPTANAGTDVSIPNGTSTALSAASGGPGTYTYSWAPSGSLVNANVQNPTTTNLSSSVTYTLTVTDNSTGCQKTDQVIVTVTGGALSVTASGTPNSICVGQSVSLYASSGGGSGTYGYTWASNPAGFSSASQNPSVSPAATTSYYVTVTDGFGSVTGTTSVTVNPLPAANAGSDVAICSGNSTPLSASGGNTYAWSPSTGLSATNISNPTASPTSAITYIVTVTSAQGCQKTDNISVTVNALPTANSGSDVSVCAGNSASINASGGNAYAWGPSTGLSATNISNPIATPASTILYTVTVTSLQGCTDTDDITITVNLLPSANAGADQSVCGGNSASLNATGGVLYIWSPSLGLSNSSISNPIATPANTTSYTVTVTNVSGCSATDNVSVTVNPVPSANAGTDFALCAGNSVNLGASGGGSYLWSPSTGLSATNTSNPTTSPATSITYTVLITNAQGCTDSDDISITVNPLPLANAGADQSICAGNTASLNATGGATYVWDHTTSLSDANIANPTATPLLSTLYNVTVTTASGCSAIDNVNITVNPLPVATAGSDQSMCNGNNAQLNATGGVLYSWNPTTGLNNPAIQNPVATPSASTIYTVIVTDTNSCSKTDTVSITVFDNPVAVAGADQTVCEGTSVNISAIGGTSYAWNTNDSTASFAITPSSSAIYTVTVTDTNGCSASDNISVTVTPLPVIALSCDPANYSVYLGQLITITASPDGYSNYNFYTDTTALQSGNLNYFSTSSLQNNQTIYISASDNGCYSVLDSINLLVKPIPNAFTPRNADNVNDVFLKGLNITIFNRWGQELYTGKNGWDGKYNGKYVSAGTYYFALKLYDVKNVESEIKGSVTIVE